MRYRVLALLWLPLLGGCAWITNYFSGTDNTPPPTPLTAIKPQLKVEKLWSVDLGAGSKERELRLTPAVSGDKVFIADRKGTVRAVGLNAGRRIWNVDVKAPISAGPGYGDGLVLVGTSDARVLALHAADGRVAWQSAVSSEVLSVPRAGDGVVVVRTVDGRLTGLSEKDGKRLWVYDRGEPILSLRGTSSPVLAGNRVVAGFDNAHLVALSLRDGRVLWDQTIAFPHGRSELERLVDIDGNPVVSDDTVYVVSYQGRVAALTLDGGRLLWSRDMSSFAGLAVGRQRVYITDDESRVWALDRQSGASFWKQDKLKWRGLTAPALSGGAVVVGDSAGYLHWLSTDDGHIVARARAGESGFASAPVAVGDRLLVFGEDGALTAFKVGGKP
jgi:outer membrane protein assembly factor BamB